jgi:hypothetical protein
MAYVQHSSKGFVPLLAAVSMLSMATATLRLTLGNWLEARPKPAQQSITKATRILEPTSPAAAATAIPTRLLKGASLAPVPATETRDLAPPPAAAATAMPTGLREPPSLTTMATEVRDLASPDAAGAKARAVVEGSFGIPNAKILERVIVQRIGDGSSVSRAKRPRYQTQVVVELPRGLGLSIQRQYFLTLQYVGGGEWHVEDMTFATRY